MNQPNSKELVVIGLLDAIEEIDFLLGKSDHLKEQGVLERSKVENLIKKGEGVLNGLDTGSSRRPNSPIYSQRGCDLYDILTVLRKKLVKKLLKMRGKIKILIF